VDASLAAGDVGGTDVELQAAAEALGTYVPPAEPGSSSKALGTNASLAAAGRGGYESSIILALAAAEGAECATGSEAALLLQSAEATGKANKQLSPQMEAAGRANKQSSPQEALTVIQKTTIRQNPDIKNISNNPRIQLHSRSTKATCNKKEISNNETIPISVGATGIANLEKPPKAALNKESRNLATSQEVLATTTSTIEYNYMVCYIVQLPNTIGGYMNFQDAAEDTSPYVFCYKVCFEEYKKNEGDVKAQIEKDQVLKH
jgi:hypothetical protein